MLVGKMKLIQYRSVITAVAVFATLALSLSFAQPAHGQAGAGTTPAAGAGTTPAAGAGTAPTVRTGDTFGLTPFEAETRLGTSDLRSTVARIINAALTLLGVIAVIIILMGGFKWMTAGGNDDKVGEAKKMIGAGVIGLIIILSAYSITRFVIGQASFATQTGNVQGFTP